MIATAAPVSYVKRYKMEMDLRDLPAQPALPPSYRFVPWSRDLLDAHAEVLHRSFRQEIDAPLIAGSGIDETNASQFADADAAIVGTSLKGGGEVDNEVDRDRVERVVRAFKRPVAR